MQTSGAKTPVLVVRLPRHVVDGLRAAPAGSARLVLGGKERITTGTLFVGGAKYDVRYSGERSGAPPLLLHGGAGSDGWAPWTQRGKVAGKLTVVHKGRAAAQPVAPERPVAAERAQPAMPERAPPAVPKDAGAEEAPRAAPQKKPGIRRHNREMLRERIVHMLALGPMDEDQVLGDVDSAPAAALEVLDAVATRKGTMWALQPASFRLVNIEAWPRYDAPARAHAAEGALRALDALGVAGDDPERLRLRRIQQRLAGDPPEEPPTPKKKPARASGPQSLAKKLRLEATKRVRRIHGLEAGPGFAAAPAGAAPEPKEAAARPAPLEPADGRAAAAGPGGDAGWRHMASAPATAVGGSFGAARDADPERRARPRRRSSVAAGSRSRSRRTERSPAGADAGSERPGHQRVRSRPLQLQPLRGAATEADTGAAVGRVQERLALMNERRPLPAAARPHSPSPSPAAAAAQQSPSPPPSPALAEWAELAGRAETVEGLRELQARLVAAYAEYSQLRLRIDARCAAFAPLAAELDAAQAALAAARAQQPGEAEREEGEEVPGDLGVDATASERAPSGARLLYRCAPGPAGAAWVTDSPAAGAAQQRLLPEEARVLRATQAVADRYAELGAGDVRRWARRYLRLHAAVGEMARALPAAHSRVAAAIAAQRAALCADAGLEPGLEPDPAPAPAPAPRVLDLAMFREGAAAAALD
ncbi:hypothetical protein H4R18_000984 [Coemansia javaensis]|uniref:RNA polymerase II elongation factor ELL N-terminal domain-containing protein n=1 Tax=Coemansia javaensis TaxID=2761396 RepID=A0A9W8HGH4_9FUNG|nr:hypothetical protein H4R18_000984 [Coemansia javaensis]